MQTVIAIPESLAHFGLQGIVSRFLFRRVDVRWILLGSVLPSAPGLLAAVAPALDVHTLRIYFVCLGSLFGTLLLVGAMAALAPRPRLVLGVLTFNAVLHLVLEACVTRWGDGVAFGAPLSWELTSFELFWPESWIVTVARWIGVAFLAWVWRRGLWAPIRLTIRRWPLILILLVAWAATPIAMGDRAYWADVHNARTLRSERAGRPVAFDRALFDGELKPWDGETYRLWPAPSERANVSLRGVLAVPHEIVVEEIHIHPDRRGDYFSFAGLALLAVSWGVGLWRGRSQPSEC